MNHKQFNFASASSLSLFVVAVLLWLGGLGGSTAVSRPNGQSVWTFSVRHGVVSVDCDQPLTPAFQLGRFGIPGVSYSCAEHGGDPTPIEATVFPGVVTFQSRQLSISIWLILVALAILPMRTFMRRRRASRAGICPEHGTPADQSVESST